MTTKQDTTQPKAVAGYLLVRIRPESHDIGLGHLRLWRITHPQGRQRLAGTGNYLTRERARKVAEENGWRVVGGAA